MRRLVVVLGAVVAAGSLVAGQSYSSGQPVWPAFEGWEQNVDGSSSFVFGYMNDNWQQEFDVPVGPDNAIEPGGPDRGQPTHLLPRRNRFTFRVRVPKDWGDKEMIWSLSTQGVARKAFASRRTDLLIENIDIMSETGALGAGTSSPAIRANTPPVVTIVGPTSLAAKAGEPLTLTATVDDDGVPRRRGGPPPARNVLEGLALRPPARITVGKTLGLHLSWFVYRGSGPVAFEPRQVKTWEDTRAGANSPWAPLWQPPPAPADRRYVVTATFAEPGTYVLRARADDGGLTADKDVTVTVTR